MEKIIRTNFSNEKTQEKFFVITIHDLDNSPTIKFSITNGTNVWYYKNSVKTILQNRNNDNSEKLFIKYLKQSLKEKKVTVEDENGRILSHDVCFNVEKKEDDTIQLTISYEVKGGEIQYKHNIAQFISKKKRNKKKAVLEMFGTLCKKLIEYEYESETKDDIQRELDTALRRIEDYGEKEELKVGQAYSKFTYLLNKKKKKIREYGEEIKNLNEKIERLQEINTKLKNRVDTESEDDDDDDDSDGSKKGSDDDMDQNTPTETFDRDTEMLDGNQERKDDSQGDDELLNDLLDE